MPFRRLGPGPVPGRQRGRHVVAVHPHRAGQLEGRHRVHAALPGDLQHGVDRDAGDDPEAREHRVDVDALLGPQRPDGPQRVALQAVLVDSVPHRLDGQRHRSGDVRPHLLGVERPERRHLGAHLLDRLVDHQGDGEVLEQVDHDPLQARVHGDSLCDRTSAAAQVCRIDSVEGNRRRSSWLKGLHGPGTRPMPPAWPVPALLADPASPGPAGAQRVPAPGGGGHHPTTPRSPHRGAAVSPCARADVRRPSGTDRTRERRPRVNRDRRSGGGG